MPKIKNLRYGRAISQTIFLKNVIPLLMHLSIMDFHNIDFYGMFEIVSNLFVNECEKQNHQINQKFVMSNSNVLLKIQLNTCYMKVCYIFQSIIQIQNNEDFH